MLLTIPEVAERLRLSEYHTYEMVRAGELRAVRIGRLVRIREDDLQAFVESRTIPAEAREQVSSR